jgi:hypothetical protein
MTIWNPPNLTRWSTPCVSPAGAGVAVGPRLGSTLPELQWGLRSNTFQQLAQAHVEGLGQQPQCAQARLRLSGFDSGHPALIKPSGGRKLLLRPLIHIVMVSTLPPWSYWVMKIFLVAMALLLTVAAAVTTHHLYEQHLSSGYAPVFKAAMAGSYEERTQYIHETREFVRTDNDRETEAKLELMQEDFSGETTSTECGQLFAVRSIAESAFDAAFVRRELCRIQGR